MRGAVVACFWLLAANCAVRAARVRDDALDAEEDDDAVSVGSTMIYSGNISSAIAETSTRGVKIPDAVRRLLVTVNAIKKNMIAKRKLCGRLYGLFYSDQGKHRIKGLILVAGAGAAAVGADSSMHQEWAAIPVYAPGSISTASGVVGTLGGLQPGVEEITGPIVNVDVEHEAVWPQIKAWLKRSKIAYGVTTAAVVAGAMVLDGAAHGGTGGAFTIKAFTWAASNGVTAVATHAGASTVAANGLNLAWGITGAALASTDVHDYWLQGNSLKEFHDEVYDACHLVMNYTIDNPILDMNGQYGEDSNPYRYAWH